MRHHKTVERFDDTMVETSVTVETRPAVIDYADILDACEIVPDEDMGAPWKECDGWDHDFERIDHEGQEDARGYVPSRDRIVVLSDDMKADYRYYRERGCSKQVAAEMVAQQKRNRLDMLTKWRDDGYEWWGVTCDYMERDASCFGVDDYDHARDEVRGEIADEVADQLEEDGYTVENRPDRRAEYLANRRHHLKMNLRMDCWTD